MGIETLAKNGGADHVLPSFDMHSLGDGTLTDEKDTVIVFGHVARSTVHGYRFPKVGETVFSSYIHNDIIFTVIEVRAAGDPRDMYTATLRREKVLDKETGAVLWIRPIPLRDLIAAFWRGIWS